MSLLVERRPVEQGENIAGSNRPRFIYQPRDGEADAGGAHRALPNSRDALVKLIFIE